MSGVICMYTVCLSAFNRRVFDCSSVVQTEKDLFQPEIRLFMHENCQNVSD